MKSNPYFESQIIKKPIGWKVYDKCRNCYFRLLLLLTKNMARNSKIALWEENRNHFDVGKELNLRNISLHSGRRYQGTPVIKQFCPQVGLEPTPLKERNFQVKCSTTELQRHLTETSKIQIPDESMHFPVSRPSWKGQ